MKTKTYTKHKKNTTNDEWEKSGQNCTMPVKSVRLRKETQLDRIERKLDELLSRPAVTPPGQWTQHTYPCDPPPTCPVDNRWPYTRTDRPVRYPVGPFGEPIPYA